MSSPPPKARAGRCPICGRPPDAKLKPFCSTRCADVDLSRWLDGRYAIPAQDSDESDARDGGGDGEGEA